MGKDELRPVLTRMLDIAIREEILMPQAAYGYWPCAAEGNDVILFAEDRRREIARFSFPRQNKDGGLCIADFFRDVDAGERDVIGLQVVTMGRRASEAAREWFADNRYQDYLYLHGLSVEMAEALAEYLHRRIRGELGFAAEEARDTEAMLNQGYRGSRYSFGYPACPNLADQSQLLELLQRRGDRHHALRRRPARPRAIDLGDHRPSPPGEIFYGLSPARVRECRIPVVSGIYREILLPNCLNS